MILTLSVHAKALMLATEVDTGWMNLEIRRERMKDADFGTEF